MLDATGTITVWVLLVTGRILWPVCLAVLLSVKDLNQYKKVLLRTLFGAGVAFDAWGALALISHSVGPGSV